MINVNDELRNNFFIYASCVNNERSFPDVRDGLKPSQRAVLWEMYSKGYGSKKPHVKSAKVAGGVIASWWPHGDSSSYEALVRMSQPWLNNIPEIDFHGANGSVLGGPQAASSRYTECRLSKAAEDGLFNSIDRKVVDMIPNFSEDEEWPSVLPAIFPRLFVNGSQGIGYTIAQEWEPGNLREFLEKVKEYLQTSDISFDNIYPDYPTGGIIINRKEIADIYRTGKGRVVIRGRAEISGNNIKITDLPYQVYVEPFIQKIKDLVNSGGLAGIEDVYNKSDDSGLLIEILCSTDAESVLAKLYKLTELQSVFSVNQMALVDGTPTMLTLKDYIEIYLAHNLETIRKEYLYELNKATTRLEIVQGLIFATSVLDDIIREIRASKNSSDAVNSLKQKFSFTDLQAQAIVDMRLGKLANTEVEALIEEQNQLNKTINDCNQILGSDRAQKKEFLKRLNAFTTKYGWPRRTKVIDVDLAVEKTKMTPKVKVVENYTILLESNGNIKRILTSQYKANKKVKYCTVEAPEDQKILLISDRGIMYKLPVKQIPKASVNSIGTPVSALVSLQDRESIIQIFSGFEPESYIFFVTKRGLAKKTLYQDINKLSKNIGAVVMKLADDDQIILCKLVESEKISVDYCGKEKIINTDKFIAKSRTAGGVVAVKIKSGSHISIPQ